MVSMRYLIVFLLCIVSAYADEKQLTGQQWLDKINHAMKTLNYQGTVVFMKNSHLDTMRYQHRIEKGIEYETLSSLNSPLREVTRKSNQISCLFKETGEHAVDQHPIDRSFIVNLPQNTANLDQQYLLTVVGQESIAMRATQIIAVLPKDQLRYARKIWVDAESFLPLKIEVYGLDGNTLEQVLFTDLKLDALEEDASAVGEEKIELNQNAIHDLGAAFDSSPFRLKNWPEGFKSVFFVRNSLQKSKKTVDHLLISDGFSSISVYFEPKDQQALEGLRSLGSVNSFSRVLGDLQITVLGEVPAKTVEFVAAGVALR